MSIFGFGWLKRSNDYISRPETNYTTQYLETVLKNWLHSEGRKERLLGEKYYEGYHDILERQRTAIGKDGKVEILTNVPNYKIVDNQYRKLIDQKTNFILGKPLTLVTQNKDYLKIMNEVFNKKMHRKLRVLARYAIEGGIAWVYPYIDTDGQFDIAVFPSTAVCPIWEDKLHTRLNAAIRYFEETVIQEDGSVDLICRAELYTKDGVYRYRYNNGQLIFDNKYSMYLRVGRKAKNWGKIPVIPFKYNDSEIPLIRGTKSLQDAMNLAMSDFQNTMAEDSRNTILVIKNYDGTEVEGSRDAINTHGIIKVTTIDGVQGGVDVLRITIDSDVFQAFLMQTKRALIESGRGFDAKEERMDGDPNEMNIQSMYTDIDLDMNGLETEFQAGFDELKWFIDQYLLSKGEGDYSKEELKIVFKRDIFINESVAIDNCVKAAALVSEGTAIAHLPWDLDPQEETKQKKAERQEEMDMMTADNIPKAPSVGSDNK